MRAMQNDAHRQLIFLSGVIKFAAKVRVSNLESLLAKLESNATIKATVSCSLPDVCKPASNTDYEAHRKNGL